MDINIMRYVFIASASVIMLCELSKYMRAYLPLTVMDIHYSKYATATTHNTLANINVPKK